MEKEIKISVRNLVEFLLRSGDLDNRRTRADNQDAMNKGSRLHRKLQKQQTGDYKAEVPLSYTWQKGEIALKVEGRADGIFTKDITYIEEIKGMCMDVTKLEQPIEVHLAQAKCYAYFYAIENQKEMMGIRMTYANLENEKLKQFELTFSIEELKNWYDSLMKEYYKWIKLNQDWKEIRNISMKELQFPFEYRKGQRMIVASVYRTIEQQKELFVQAPTGVGKTMSTVFPSIRSMGEELCDKLFYLTAKTITRTVANDAIAILRERGLRFRSIMLTAKEKLCVAEQMQCNPENCEYAKGHFDRVNDAVFEMIQKEEILDRETLLKYAHKWKVCPFEMSLDAALWSDGIICDYNYVFDPNVYLRRFFGEGKKEKYVFLIDEAHNLVERARSMYSAEVYKEEVLEVKKKLNQSKDVHLIEASKLVNQLERLNAELLEYKRECEEPYQMLGNPGILPVTCMNVAEQLQEYLEVSQDAEVRETALEFYFKVRNFLNICDLLDENYVVYSAHESDGRFKIKLFCVNPAQNLQNCIDRGQSAVFFSATLLPMQYYQSLFSTNEENYRIAVSSPFEEKKRKILLCRDVSSKYTRRGQQEYLRIAQEIHQVTRAKKGNYLAFFPSYQMMQEIAELYQDKFKKETLVLQSMTMNEVEREEFLEKFSDIKSHKIGFCVLGGIFSEGIDLVGEKLIGVMIIGTGLPMMSKEREILKNYYDKSNGNGFNYAYRYPGMNKVQQAAGRVIRTKEDKGIIALMDERFLERESQMLFPEEWQTYEITDKKNIKKKIEEFWNTCERMEEE